MRCGHRDTSGSSTKHVRLLKTMPTSLLTSLWRIFVCKQPRVVQASPIRNILGRWAASPMSVERGGWGGHQSRHRSHDEGRGTFCRHACCVVLRGRKIEVCIYYLLPSDVRSSMCRKRKEGHGVCFFFFATVCLNHPVFPSSFCILERVCEFACLCSFFSQYIFIFMCVDITFTKKFLSGFPVQHGSFILPRLKLIAL